MKKISKNVIYLGDIHGNIELVKYYCRINKLKDCVIVQVGDFGLGLMNNEQKRLEDLNNILANLNIDLLVIRGNHDNKDLWYNDKYTYLTNINFVKDYEVIEIDNKNHLFIGGATSIDRNTRTINKDYWENEVIQFGDDEKHFLENLTNVDVLVTHAAPTFVAPLIQRFDNDDRIIMTEIFDILNKNNTILEHYYGHYHFNDITYIGETKHVLLGIGELK